MSKEYKGKIAFFYRNSWNHRIKTLDENGKVKYGKRGGFKTPEEAEQSYYEYERVFEEQCRNRVVPEFSKEILLKDYLIYWYENIYSCSRESTTSMIYSYVIYNLIIPSLPYDIKVRLTTSDYIDRVLIEIDNLGKTTANKSREVLNQAFQDAKSEGLITINPVSATKEYTRGKVTITILDEEEIKKLLSATCTGKWYLEILLALFCGLRKGEILGLKFSDIDLENKTLKINRQLAIEYKMKKGKYVIDSRKIVERDPKTPNSFRKLRLPQIIVDEILKRKNIVDENKNAYKEEYCDNDYVSCQENGIAHDFSGLNNYITKICQKNGIPKITVHGLRHMFATILIEQGVKLAKISALLGHSSVHTTFDLYCDIIEEKKKIKAFINNTFVIGDGEDE